MLKQLILENWKSFRYAELPLDPLTVLIGTNASGKSNVVEALEFLKRIARGEKIEAALKGDKTLPSIRGGVEWAVRKPETEFTLKVIIQTEDTTTDLIYTIRVQTNPNVKILEESLELRDNSNPNSISDVALLSEKNIQKSCISEQIIRFNNVEDNINLIKKGLDDYQIALEEIENMKKQLYFMENNVNKSIKDKISELRQSIENNETIVRNQFNNSKQNIKSINQEVIYLKPDIEKHNYLIYTISNTFTFNPIPSKMRDYSPLSEIIESDASNIAGVLAALDNEKKVEVESRLSAYIKDLPEGDIKKVWAEKVGRFGTDAMLYCQEEWKPGNIIEIDARSMSDGTLRFLAIVTALLTRPEGSQIVIEEIDNGLHPSRAKLLVKILREIGSKRNIDILLTTHNPALLDALGPEIVPFVVVAHRDLETGESKLTLLEDIDNFPKLFASYSLGDMTTKGAIERSLSHGE